MKKELMTLLVVISMFLLTFSVNSAYRDTGFVNYTQPNDTTFQARYWGDEFEWHMETDDGYAIIFKHADSYYYYAQLGQDGDYEPSSNKVGIDDTDGIPLHLDRSCGH